MHVSYSGWKKYTIWAEKTMLLTKGRWIWLKRNYIRD